MGRMSDLYRRDWNVQARKLATKGWTDHEIADFFAINENTLRECRMLHPEFDEAMKRGKDVVDDRVEESLQMRANGFWYDAEEVFQHNGAIIRATVRKYVIPDPKACAIWLSCRRRAAWSQRFEVTGAEGQPLVPREGNELARRIAFCLDPRFAETAKPH